MSAYEDTILDDYSLIDTGIPRNLYGVDRIVEPEHIGHPSPIASLIEAFPTTGFYMGPHIKRWEGAGGMYWPYKRKRKKFENISEKLVKSFMTDPSFGQAEDIKSQDLSDIVDQYETLITLHQDPTNIASGDHDPFYDWNTFYTNEFLNTLIHEIGHDIDFRLGETNPPNRTWTGVSDWFTGDWVGRTKGHDVHAGINPGSNIALQDYFNTTSEKEVQKMLSSLLPTTPYASSNPQELFAEVVENLPLIQRTQDKGKLGPSRETRSFFDDNLEAMIDSAMNNKPLSVKISQGSPLHHRESLSISKEDLPTIEKQYNIKDLVKLVGMIESMKDLYGEGVESGIVSPEADEIIRLPDRWNKLRW